ncbi:hypothetical protein SAY87_014216 [Trapa incisa]|uniref:Uncharacterized protein n=1 Tax=Trapa incisa TaxID=236973 RepID=A0AAN7GWD8_9MYRT|nr:hypothetical protein SAY87_014216 [Trapa incisa]
MSKRGRHGGTYIVAVGGDRDGAGHVRGGASSGGAVELPWEGEELPPEPREGWNEFIMDCAKRLTNG